MDLCRCHTFFRYSWCLVSFICSKYFQIYFTLAEASCSCGEALTGQLLAAMGYLQVVDPGSNMRWKATSDQEGAGDHSSALRGPHISKSANLGLSVRRRSVYPRCDLPSSSGSNSIPVHRRETPDESALPEDTNPFGHIQSSMARLSLQSREGISRRNLRVIHEDIEGDHVEGDSRSSESDTDDTTDSVSLPETCAPISIRSHVKARLKIPDQDRNGMRIRRSHEVGTYEASSSKHRGTKRRGNIDHNSGTTRKKTGFNGAHTEHENKNPYVRQRKGSPVPRGPPKFPGNDADRSDGYGPPIKTFVTFHCYPLAN